MTERDGDPPPPCTSAFLWDKGVFIFFWWALWPAFFFGVGFLAVFPEPIDGQAITPRPGIAYSYV